MESELATDRRVPSCRDSPPIPHRRNRTHPHLIRRKASPRPKARPRPEMAQEQGLQPKWMENILKLNAESQKTMAAALQQLSITFGKLNPPRPLRHEELYDFKLSDSPEVFIKQLSDAKKGLKRKHGQSASNRRRETFRPIEEYGALDFANAPVDKVSIDPNKRDMCFMMHHNSTAAHPRILRYTSMGRRSRLQSKYKRKTERKIIANHPFSAQIQVDINLLS
jgi:hypothetical protein